MVAASLALGWRLVIFFAAGVAGGVANGIAGGGTFITFPTLLALGVPALQANVSTTVGVVPSYLGGIRGFRFEFTPHAALIRSLVAPCLLGTGAGCALLLTGSPHLFRLIVPWLIGFATLVFALAPVINARLAHFEHDAPRRRSLVVGVFLASVYGGYFGAGMGIMLLAIMALTLPYELKDVQGLRNVLSMMINSVAALIFIVRGHLALDAVWMLLVGTLIGGWLGTRVILRLSPSVVRALVVAIGLATTVRLAIST